MMWTLLQYVSGSISKNTTDDLVSVLCLIELLYRDNEWTKYCSMSYNFKVIHYAYSDTLGTSEKCHCNRTYISYYVKKGKEYLKSCNIRQI